MRHFIQNLAMGMLLLMSTGTMTAQVQVTKKVYPYYMIPKENPDYSRHSVKSPDLSLFDGMIAFTSLRNLTDNYRADIRQYVDRDRLGNVIWPNYSFMFERNVSEITDYLASRNLYLFDL